jgi:hypothetical protein
VVFSCGHTSRTATVVARVNEPASVRRFYVLFYACSVFILTSCSLARGSLSLEHCDVHPRLPSLLLSQAYSISSLYNPVHSAGRSELNDVCPGQLVSKLAQELVAAVLSTMRQLLLKQQQASTSARRAVICCIGFCIALSAHAANGEQ